MDIKNCKLLDEVILDEIEIVRTSKDDGAKHSEAIDNLVKLHKLKIEEDKILTEHIVSGKERFLKYGLLAAEIIVPIIAYGFWFNKGLKFEETGSVTSPMIRNLMSRMIPNKKR